MVERMSGPSRENHLKLVRGQGEGRENCDTDSPCEVWSRRLNSTYVLRRDSVLATASKEQQVGDTQLTTPQAITLPLTDFACSVFFLLKYKRQVGLKNYFHHRNFTMKYETCALSDTTYNTQGFAAIVEVLNQLILLFPHDWIRFSIPPSQVSPRLQTQIDSLITM